MTNTQRICGRKNTFAITYISLPRGERQKREVTGAEQHWQRGEASEGSPAGTGSQQSPAAHSVVWRTTCGARLPPTAVCAYNKSSLPWTHTSRGLVLRIHVHFFFLQGFSTHTYTHPLCLHLLFIARCACGVCYFFLLFLSPLFCYSHWEVKNLRRFNKRCSRSSTRCDRRVSALWTVLVPTVNCALGRTAHGKHGTRTVSFPPYRSRSLSARSCAA